MGVLLIVAQVVLVILYYGAHVLKHVSPWLIWLPSIVLGTVYVVGLIFGGIFIIDGFTTIYGRRK